MRRKGPGGRTASNAQLMRAPQQVDGIARVKKAGEEEFNLTQSALQDAKAAGTTAVSSLLACTLVLPLLVSSPLQSAGFHP